MIFKLYLDQIVRSDIEYSNYEEKSDSYSDNTYAVYLVV